MSNEIIWDTRGKTNTTSRTKDTVEIAFKNGSTLSNVAMTENSRGMRFQSILVEEVAKVDQEKLTEIIMPMLVVSRPVTGHGVDPNEILSQSAVFITSAGYKMTYAYEKLINTLCEMVADKTNSEAFIFGGDWRIPVIEGLQPANFIQAQEMDNSMDEAGFDREYNSIWAGSASGVFFNPDRFDRSRTLNLAETKFNKGLAAKGYYVMGVDVGRKGDMTEAVIIKVTPQPTGVPAKQIVNIFTLESEHFEKQAIQLKRYFRDFKCEMAVVDGNGLGIGLVDELVKDHIDPDTNELLPNWGVQNDDDRSYKEWQTEDTIHNALYIMKANVPLNSEMYAYCQNQLNNGKLRFLIDEATAKNKLLAQVQGQKMTTAQRADYLRPYVETTILKSQMLEFWPFFV